MGLQRILTRNPQPDKRLRPHSGHRRMAHLNCPTVSKCLAVSPLGQRDRRDKWDKKSTQPCCVPNNIITNQLVPLINITLIGFNPLCIISNNWKFICLLSCKSHIVNSVNILVIRWRTHTFAQQESISCWGIL